MTPPQDSHMVGTSQLTDELKFAHTAGKHTRKDFYLKIVIGWALERTLAVATQCQQSTQPVPPPLLRGKTEVLIKFQINPIILSQGPHLTNSRGKNE